MSILDVKDLCTRFDSDAGPLRVVQNVSFSLSKGQTLCIVGESGCGKSVTGFSLMRLLPSPPAKIENGEVLYNGVDLLKLSENDMKNIRGNELAMIFQEPMTSLNPVLTVGQQLMETVLQHQEMSPSEAKAKCIQTLKDVGMPDPEQRMEVYPHQMSGGMKQRVMIAMALCCEPKVLIADEPTTALDVTVQAQILELLKKLQKEHGMAILLITHDLAVVSEVADEVLVMYASQVVEKAKAADLFESPQHPYTQGLLKAIPQLGQRCEALYEIEGQVPNPADFPKGCHFYDRCPKAMDICKEQKPKMSHISPSHEAACFALEQKANERGAQDA